MYIVRCKQLWNLQMTDQYTCIACGNSSTAWLQNVSSDSEGFCQRNPSRFGCCYTNDAMFPIKQDACKFEMKYFGADEMQQERG